MSWGGVWNLRYNGQNPKRFLDLCKIVIPNYQRRFEVLDENEIEAVKRISWYSADKDIAEIMKLLGENDSIDVIIDGETHPLDEYEEELPFEKQSFKIEDGKVVMLTDYEDLDRYTDDELGIIEYIETDLKDYASFLVNEFGIRDEDGKIIGLEETAKEILDKFFTDLEKSGEIKELDELRNGIEDLSWLNEQYEYYKENNNEPKKELPSILSGMSKSDIQALRRSRNISRVM